MLDDRKAAVLRAIVEQYIETDQPVGSGRIASQLDFAVSPATVRNDMAALEAEGYLHQPHTSAGRVPTEMGYRFFVDALGPGHLDGGDARRVRAFFAHARGELEAVLQETSGLLANLTSLAAVVVSPGSETTKVASVQLVPLGERLLLLVVVLSTGVVEKHAIEAAAALSEEQLAHAQRTVAASLVGATVGGAETPAPTGDPDVDDVADVAVKLAQGLSDTERIYIGGASGLVQRFEAVEQVSQVLHLLEEHYVMVGLLQELLDRGLSVAIGTETGLEPLADCSVVVAPYAIEGEQVGTLGLLGPTRMNYPQALAAVAVVSRRLGRALSEGS